MNTPSAGPLVSRIRAWRSLASPVEQFIAARVCNAPGNRLPIPVLVRAWHRHAHTLGIKPAKNSELIAAVRRAHPEAKRVPARSGRDVHHGDHLTGLALR